MKLKLVILTAAVLVGSSGYAVVHGEEGHSEHKGSMRESAGTEVFSPDSVEVGNKICPISGKAVDMMGEGVKYEHNGKIYNFCCAMCLKDFKKDPEKYGRIAEESVGAETQETPGAHEHHEGD